MDLRIWPRVLVLLFLLLCVGSSNATSPPGSPSIQAVKAFFKHTEKSEINDAVALWLDPNMETNDGTLRQFVGKLSLRITRAGGIRSITHIEEVVVPKEKSDGQVQHAVGCKITFGDNQIVICHFRVTKVNSQWKLSNVES